MNPKHLLLYLVTDRNACKGRPLLSLVEQAVLGGCTMVQVREKQLSTRDFIDEVKQIQTLLKPHAVPLIINDRVDVALATNADGVHLGQNDMSVADARRILGADKIIGLSVENMNDVVQANQEDVDYIAISPVFATPTKLDTATPFGLLGTQAAVNMSNHPAIGIGGMNSQTAGQAMSCGLHGIAVVSDILSSESPQGAARILLQKIK